MGLTVGVSLHGFTQDVQGALDVASRMEACRQQRGVRPFQPIRFLNPAESLDRFLVEASSVRFFRQFI